MSQKTSVKFNISQACNQYFSQIAEIPLLSAEKEKELAARISAGDQQAKEELIKANFRLVVSRARIYQSADVDLLDLIQDGNIGLIKAAERYSPAFGKFSTFAVYWIDRELRKQSIRTGKPLRIPPSLVPAVNHANSVIFTFKNEFGCAPTVEELSDILGLSISKTEEILVFCTPVVSLDQTPPTSDSSSSASRKLIESGFIPSEKSAEDEFLSSELKNQLNDILTSVLSPKEVFIIKNRFGFNEAQTPVTLQALSDELNMTREGVRRIEARSLKKLHTYFIKKGYNIADFIDSTIES